MWGVMAMTNWCICYRCGKVMFSQACVIPPVHNKRVCLGGDCIQSESASRGVCLEGFASRVGSASRGDLHRGGVCLGESTYRGVYLKGSASRGGLGRSLPPSDTMGYSQRAGGTHPTGLHSYFWGNFTSWAEPMRLLNYCIGWSKGGAQERMPPSRSNSFIFTVRSLGQGNVFTGVVSP